MTDETKENQELTNEEKQKKVKDEVARTKALEDKVKMMEQERQELMTQQQPQAQPQEPEPEPQQPNDNQEMIRQTISQQMEAERQKQAQMQQQQKFQQAYTQLMNSDSEAKQLSDNIQQKDGGYDAQPTAQILHYISNNYRDNINQKMMKEVLKNDTLRNNLIKDFAVGNYDKVRADIVKLSNADSPTIIEAPKNEAPDLTQHSSTTTPRNSKQKQDEFLSMMES